MTFVTSCNTLDYIYSKIYWFQIEKQNIIHGFIPVFNT